MRTITILCIGKLKERYWRDACEEYAKRLGAFGKLQIVELDEERLPDRPSAAQIEAALQAEGRRILSKIDSGIQRSSLCIALCIEGRELSSPKLAEVFDKSGVDGHANLVFIIGGSWGLSPEVKQLAGLQLSMSPMTFPHQLARVMLLEQIYRAMQISSGGKYHK